MNWSEVWGRNENGSEFIYCLLHQIKPPLEANKDFQKRLLTVIMLSLLIILTTAIIWDKYQYDVAVYLCDREMAGTPMTCEYFRIMQQNHSAVVRQESIPCMGDAIPDDAGQCYGLVHVLSDMDTGTWLPEGDSIWKTNNSTLTLP